MNSEPKLKAVSMTTIHAQLVLHLKALHVLALIIWCGGVVALPLMLSHHNPSISQSDYARIRRYTHVGYTDVVTSSAVLAVVTGTALVFLREVYFPWLFLKLVFVGALVVAHGCVGHVITLMEETRGAHLPPHPALQAASAFIPIVAILFLVLAKPEFREFRIPDWAMQPRAGQLPVFAPSR